MKDNAPMQLDHFRQVCKAHRLSVTPQRVAIYQALMGCQDHPSAEDVFNRIKTSFPDMSMDTVYRTLTTFSKIGLVRPVKGHGQPRRYDPVIDPHHHFRCQRCDRIVDFYDEQFDRLQPPQAIRSRFTVSSVKVTLEGICDVCRNQDSSTEG